MPNWEQVDDLRSFLDTVLEFYPEPDEVYRYSSSDESDADLRVGKEDIPDYKKLLKEIGVGIVEKSGSVSGNYECKAPTNTDIPHIPYIAVLDPAESKSTRYGRYVVYLFDPIEKAVYLTLNIGAAKMAEEYAKNLRAIDSRQLDQSKDDILQWLAHWYRTQSSTPSGFKKGPISISSSLSKSGVYSNGTIYYRKYTQGDLPDNQKLVQDLTTIVDTYDELISERVSNIQVDLDERRAWHVSTEGYRWSDWKSNNVASIGWKLDPDKFDNDPSTLTDIDETNIKKSEGQGFAFQFSRTISEGDIIVAGVRGKKNPHTIEGVGRVIDANPEIDPEDLGEDLRDDSHFVRVEWASFETTVPITLGRNIPLIAKTLRELDDEDLSHVLGTTLVHAVAGGLFASISKALSFVNQQTQLSGTVKEDATLEKFEEPDVEPPEEEPDTVVEQETEPDSWKLADIERVSPRFEISPDEISLPGLYFEDEDELLERILHALANGHHLLFVGPPGTGKSKLAKEVAKELVNDSFKMTTATADWSTFDTIGGYQQQQSGELEFSPGIFLDRFQDAEGAPKNEWLIIDEFNRANIDKAFGPFFSVLAGDDVVLPFKRDDNDITVYGSKQDQETRVQRSEFVVPQEWRLLATMNTFDKSSLYDLSYALSRRFSYIHIPAPTSDDIDPRLVSRYVRCWNDISPSQEEIKAVVDLWSAVQPQRPLGPAIAHDVLAAASADMTPGVLQHMLPQFEGMMNREQKSLLEAIAETGHVDTEELQLFGEQYFELDDLDL